MQGGLAGPCSGPCRTARPGRERRRLQSARINAILAPPPQHGPVSAAEPSSSSAGVFSWGANAGFGLRLWPIGQDTQREAQQVQQALQEASRQQASKAGKERPVPDVGRFLFSCSSHELRHIRTMASLTSLTYYMHTLTPRSLRLRHGLELVYTSLACERVAYEPTKTAEEALAEGDGMAVSLADARSTYAHRDRSTAELLKPPGVSNIVSLKRSKGAMSPQPVVLKQLQQAQQQQEEQQQGLQAPPALVSPSIAIPPAAVAAVTAAAGAALAADAAGVAEADAEVTNTASTSATSNSSSGSSASAGANAASSGWKPADLVAAKLAEAAAVASAAALQPLASAAGSLYSSSMGFVSSAFSQQLPVERLAAGVIGAGVLGAETTSSGPHNPPEIRAASTSACPSQWFVADDAASHTRYFAIQGSDSIDHWKCNLTFDPVVFEDPKLGVLVHRGVYEAAKALYDRFLPLVQEQLDTSPLAKVCFTGHSIGGSMALLLTLLFKHRGVVSASQMAPCYTFGAPAVFCENASCCPSCAPASSRAAAANATQGRSRSGRQPEAYHGVQVAGGGTVLQALGLKEDAVRNIIMHKDIVPRAFACDYTLVADVLRSWGSGFKQTRCLAREGRKHMYFFVGQMMVLQPDAALTFAKGEPYHPMLPAEPGLFVVQEPTLSSTVRAMCAARSRSSSSSRAAALAVAAGAGSRAAAAGSDGAKAVSTASEVMWELMDNPHPLDILADPGAYLPSGSISRYHNPEHYKRAVSQLLAKGRDAAAEGLTAASAVPVLAAKQRPFFPVVSAANAKPQSAPALHQAA